MTRKNRNLIDALRCAGSVHEIDEDLGCGCCPYAVNLDVPDDEMDIFDSQCNLDRMLRDAADRLEELALALAAACDERNAAVADLASALGDIENIRQRYGVDSSDADEALSCICESYCRNAGWMCYKGGNRRQCENFHWRGTCGEGYDV